MLRGGRDGHPAEEKGSTHAEGHAERNLELASDLVEINLAKWSAERSSDWKVSIFDPTLHGGGPQTWGLLARGRDARLLC
jgi:hypothetical protein